MVAPLEIQSDPFPSRREDMLVNPFLGYGTSRDKVAAGSFFASIPLSYAELHALYYGTDVAAMIVDARPTEMFRRGYKVVLSTDEKRAAKLQKKGEALGLDAKLKEAIVAGRLWGGALLVLGAIDGVSDLTKPLDESRVREVRYLNVVDRRFAHVDSWQTDPMKPKYGEPETWTISGQDAPSVTVHCSRVIRFVGVEPDQVTRRQFGGWGYSVLQRPYETVKQFETAFASAGVLLSDASQAVWKIKDLAELIATDREALNARMALTDMSRSAGRGIMVDAEHEDFNRVATSFSGLDGMLDRFMMRLAAASKMPVTLLMGRSPAGQNATGDSDFRAWYDSVGSDQESDLKPALLRVYRLLDVADGGKATVDPLERKDAEEGDDEDDPEDDETELDIEFTALWEPTEAEQATTAKTQADSDKIYVDMGALHPEEVALARFGSGNGKIDIDEAALKKSLKAERKLAAQPAPKPLIGPDGLPVQAPPPGAPGTQPAQPPGVPTTPPDGEDAPETPPTEPEDDEG